MATSKDELIEKVVATIGIRTNPDPVATMRTSFLGHIRDLLQKNEFPLPTAVRLDCCIMPFIFQEFNYDDIDWTNRSENLGHLSDLVEIDTMIWSGGTKRHELSDSQYNEYVEFCLGAIDYRKKQQGKNP